MHNKKGLNQIDFGSVYDTEKYYKCYPSTDLIQRYFFGGDECSCTLHTIAAGLPGGPHTHHNEQFLVIPQGDGEALCDGVAYKVEPGWFAYFPSNLPHGYNSGSATYETWNIDVFYPARLEYREDIFWRIMSMGKDPMATAVTKENESEYL